MSLLIILLYIPKTIITSLLLHLFFSLFVDVNKNRTLQLDSMNKAGLNEVKNNNEVIVVINMLVNIHILIVLNFFFK